SHVLGALLASSPLLAQAWSHCTHANASNSSFVVEHHDDTVYVAFSGTQTSALSSSVAGGELFGPVPISTGGGQELFAPLVGGGKGDDAQPVLVQAAALRLFLSL
ncbi:unnamed protein product, partial [Musa textilis]